jgi:hypothetical protein
MQGHNPHDFSTRIILKKLDEEMKLKKKGDPKNKKKGNQGKGEEGEEKDGEGNGEDGHLGSHAFRKNHLHCTHDTLEQIACLVGGALGRGEHGPPERVLKEISNRMLTAAFKANMMREHREVRLKMAKEHRFKALKLKPDSLQVRGCSVL